MMNLDSGKMYVAYRMKNVVYGNFCSGNGAPPCRNTKIFNTVDEAKHFINICKGYNGVVSYKFFHTGGKEM